MSESNVYRVQSKKLDSNGHHRASHHWPSGSPVEFVIVDAEPDEPQGKSAPLKRRRLTAAQADAVLNDPHIEVQVWPSN